jgi:hypothetical protein
LALSLRSLIAIVVLIGALTVRLAQAVELERGAAITDPAVLRELDHGRFALRHMLRLAPSAGASLANNQLFGLPSMAPVHTAIDAEFDRYVAKGRAAFPNETIGIGEGFGLQLFDRSALYSADTRFVLAGVVNRMDRAYLSPETCGEIRLIYRLTREGDGPDQNEKPRRLPMTLNVVVPAKAPKSAATLRAPAGGRPEPIWRPV